MRLEELTNERAQTKQGDAAILDDSRAAMMGLEHKPATKI
jgi:hypothetical protein